MIYKRVAARLRAQDWLAITIEFAIVVAGVFVGTMVANWNQSRLEQQESRRLLVQIQPDLIRLRDYAPDATKYYATTRHYAATALAGWRGDPRVSDSDFVIAAYQASQVTNYTFNAGTWASVMGAEQVRALSDPELRRKIAGMMSADFSGLQLEMVATPYRQKVREVIPLEVAESIRSKCGDRTTPDGHFALPPTCALAIDPAVARATADQLRARPELAGELAAHFSQVGLAQQNATLFADYAGNVEKEIDRFLGREAPR